MFVAPMQQEYKKDVVKRFYVYHAASTVLQLETLEPVKITSKDGKEYTEKNYSGIEPVITLVWMVHDNLGFTDDFLNLKNDKDMAEIIDRLKKDNWSKKEFKYVSDLHEYDLLLVKKDIENEKKLERQKKRLEKRAAVQVQKAVQEAVQKAEQADKKAEQEKLKAEQLQNKLLRLIKILLKQGDSIPSIARILELSEEETTELIKLIHDEEKK